MKLLCNFFRSLHVEPHGRPLAEGSRAGKLARNYPF
jgi:hypothetical protein